jgi:hypothetical protein
MPLLVSNLKKAGRDTAVDVADVIALDEPLHARIGFLLAAKFDFGSPKSINAIYSQMFSNAFSDSFFQRRGQVL